VSTVNDRIRALVAAGETRTSVIASAVGCDVTTVRRHLRQDGVPPSLSPVQPSAWTEAKVELLRELHHDGLTASQMAARIGGVSRNAVISKLHRIGLAGGGPKRAYAPRLRRPVRKPNPRPPMVYGNPALRNLYVLHPERQPFQELDIPMAERRSIQTLEEVDCRWPIGDPQHPDFHFCGRHKIAGLPYCDVHARVTYEPPVARRPREPAERIPTFADSEAE
jgi:GcrA cell cycle regulator